MNNLDQGEQMLREFKELTRNKRLKELPSFKKFCKLVAELAMIQRGK